MVKYLCCLPFLSNSDPKSWNVRAHSIQSLLSQIGFKWIFDKKGLLIFVSSFSRILTFRGGKGRNNCNVRPDDVTISVQ